MAVPLALALAQRFCVMRIRQIMIDETREEILHPQQLWELHATLFQIAFSPLTTSLAKDISSTQCCQEAPSGRYCESENKRLVKS